MSITDSLSNTDAFCLSSITQMNDHILEKLRIASVDVFVNSDVMNPSILKGSGTVHDWRKHVPDIVKSMWVELTERERRLVMIVCERAADNEEWD